MWLKPLSFPFPGTQLKQERSIHSWSKRVSFALTYLPNYVHIPSLCKVCMYVCRYVVPAITVYIRTYCRCLSLSWNFLHEHSLIFRACWFSCPHCCFFKPVICTSEASNAPVMPHHPPSHAEGQTNTSFSAACVSKCCENPSKCDHLWLLHGKCYSVKCFSAEMCTPVETELPSSLIKMSPSE